MTKSISWPTALVVLGLLFIYGILVFKGQPVPQWLTYSLGAAGMVIAGFMKGILQSAPKEERSIGLEPGDAAVKAAEEANK